MLLICPSCSTQYHVDEANIPDSGRSVKCASCGHAWRAGAWNHTFDSTPQGTGNPYYEEMRQVPYFSKPMSASRGGAALAALFENPSFEQNEEDIIEGTWETVDPEYSPIEARLEEALKVEPIARLVEQQKNEETQQGSPFHEEISALVSDGLANKATSRTVRDDIEIVEEDGPVSADNKATSPESSEQFRAEIDFSDAFVHLMRSIVAVFNQLGDQLDEALTSLFTLGRRNEQSNRTPGDEQVSYWRLRERRRARNKMTPLRLIGWICWFGAVGGILYGGIVHRDKVMTAWPNAERIYAQSGIAPVSLADAMNFKDISHRYALSDQGPVIELRGALSHTGERPARTPLLQARAVDPEGVELAVWIFDIGGPRQLSPQMETPFLTRFLAPEGVSTLELGVVSQELRDEIEVTRSGEVSPVLPAGEGDASGFFMQKTTIDWQAGQTDQVPPTSQEK